MSKSISSEVNTVIVFGNKIHDEYISKTDSDIIESMLNLGLYEPEKYTKPDIIIYKLFPGDISPRYEDGENLYSIKVDKTGNCTNEIKSRICPKMDIYIKTSRAATDIYKCQVYSYEKYYNKFTITKPSCVDNMYMYRNRRCYKIIYQCKEWIAEFAELYACPDIISSKPDHKLYFRIPPKHCFRLVTKDTYSIKYIKTFLRILLPRLYRI